MDRLIINKVISPKDELISLFEFSAINYRCEENGIRLSLADKRYKWETLCRFTQSTVLIYGMYPFKASEREKILNQLNKINRQLITGTMFLENETVVMRTSADLFDAYNTHETIARALEYNAGAITKLWRTLQPKKEIKSILSERGNAPRNNPWS